MTERRILLLHGAVWNAGDFLIRDRALALIRHLVPEAQLEARFRLEVVDPVLQRIDMAVLAGGPAVGPDMVPTIHPSIPKLLERGIPTRLLAVGRNGVDDDGFVPSPPTLNALERLTTEGAVSVRDPLTKRDIDQRVTGEAVMTGCVAWYDRSTLEAAPVAPGKVSRIAFTTPASPRLQPQALRVLRGLRKAIPDAGILVSYHRGILPSRSTGRRAGAAYSASALVARSWGASVGDLSGSGVNFAKYDGIDFHVGYRVHAHLFFLSVGKPSILIAEDRRGAGQQAAFDDPYRLAASSESVVADAVAAAEEEMMTFAGFDTAQRTIRNTYPTMESFVQEMIGGR